MEQVHIFFSEEVASLVSPFTDGGREHPTPDTKSETVHTTGINPFVMRKFFFMSHLTEIPACHDREFTNPCLLGRLFLAELGKVLRWISIELLHAPIAAELNLRSTMVDHNRCPHLSKLLPGDHASRERVGCMRVSGKCNSSKESRT